MMLPGFKVSMFLLGAAIRGLFFYHFNALWLLMEDLKSVCYLCLNKGLMLWINLTARDLDRIFKRIINKTAFILSISLELGILSLHV
ncbi:MAG: hypothetical protein ACJAT7_001488 [Psychromonas sp.]|jgi:hypothetical protein